MSGTGNQAKVRLLSYPQPNGHKYIKAKMIPVETIPGIRVVGEDEGEQWKE
jgi:hypothetical protein